MPHKIKLAPSSYEGIRPSSNKERRTLLKVAGSFALGLITVAILWQVQQKWQRVRELNWENATAIIEQVRPVLVGKVDSQYGGKMLYQAEVFVSYNVHGEHKESWVTIRQAPKSLADIQLEAVQWKGQTCTVLWNPANSEQVDVELGPRT